MSDSAQGAGSAANDAPEQLIQLSTTLLVESAAFIALVDETCRVIIDRGIGGPRSGAQTVNEPKPGVVAGGGPGGGNGFNAAEPTAIVPSSGNSGLAAGQDLTMPFLHRSTLTSLRRLAVTPSRPSADATPVKAVANASAPLANTPLAHSSAADTGPVALHGPIAATQPYRALNDSPRQASLVTALSLGGGAADGAHAEKLPVAQTRLSTRDHAAPERGQGLMQAAGWHGHGNISRHSNTSPQPRVAVLASSGLIRRDDAPDAFSHQTIKRTRQSGHDDSNDVQHGAATAPLVAPDDPNERRHALDAASNDKRELDSGRISSPILHSVSSTSGDSAWTQELRTGNTSTRLADADAAGILREADQVAEKFMRNVDAILPGMGAPLSEAAAVTFRPTRAKRHTGTAGPCTTVSNPLALFWSLYPHAPSKRLPSPYEARGPPCCRPTKHVSGRGTLLGPGSAGDCRIRPSLRAPNPHFSHE